MLPPLGPQCTQWVADCPLGTHTWPVPPTGCTWRPGPGGWHGVGRHDTGQEARLRLREGKFLSQKQRHTFDSVKLI